MPVRLCEPVRVPGVKKRYFNRRGRLGTLGFNVINQLDAARVRPVLLIVSIRRDFEDCIKVSEQ